MRFVAFLAVTLVAGASVALAQPEPDNEILAEVNQLGAMLDAYDHAAWHGTDAVMPMLRRDAALTARVRGYVVKETATGWQVGFGMLTEDGAHFAVAYEAILDHTFGVRETVAFETPDLRSGFYRAAMAARDSAMARFEPPEPVTYNTAVIPASDELLYVYLLPAQPDHEVFYLGADYRFEFDIQQGVITDVVRLHSALLTFDFRNEVVMATFSTVILTDHPTETDVFFARRRPPAPDGRVTHYVVSQEWVFTLDGSGVVAHLPKDEFLNRGDTGDE